MSDELDEARRALPFDPKEFAARGMRPSRPRFADALSVVSALPPDAALAAWERTRELRAKGTRVEEVWVRRPSGVRDPVEAWELLAARGVIPRAWAERDPARCRVRCECPECVWYRHRPSRRAKCRACGGAGEAVGEGVAPPTIRGCLTLASDPDGVARAEELARELSVRLGARCASDPTVEWNVLAGPGAFRRELTADGPLARAYRDLNARHAEYYRLAPEGQHPRYVAPMRALRAVCELGACHEAGGDVFGLVEWDAPEPSPFEPLVAIWLTGYAVEDVNDNGVVLVAASV